jgi:hypothetical protein
LLRLLRRWSVLVMVSALLYWCAHVWYSIHWRDLRAAHSFREWKDYFMQQVLCNLLGSPVYLFAHGAAVWVLTVIADRLPTGGQPVASGRGRDAPWRAGGSASQGVRAVQPFRTRA